MIEIDGCRISAEQLLDAQEDLIFLVNPAGLVLYANQKARYFFPESSMIDNLKPFWERIELFDEGSGMFVTDPEFDWKGMETLNKLRDRFITLKCEDGQPRVINCRVAQMTTSTGEVVYSLSIRDVSVIYKNETSMRYMSFHDKLTGLYNRAFFEEELERLNQSRQLPISIIMGDVNGLKLINDIFGHLSGDRLLKMIAEVMKSTCRTEDIISRWGGDEFVILLPDVGEDDASAVCERIQEACRRVSEEVFRISISLGYASKKDMNESLSDIFNLAESVMYKEKLMNGYRYKDSLISIVKEVLHKSDSTPMISTVRFRMLSNATAFSMGLNASERQDLEMTLLFRDIGKIAIAEYIFEKRDALTELEWEEIKRHPEIGYRLARSANDMTGISDYILAHHEHWDGTGYPLGLSGEKIPKLARVVAIYDAYLSMTSARPYRRRFSHDEAIHELKQQSGKQFDPEILKMIIPILEEVFVNMKSP
jgi:diguanylate cyclase (GGDEF)-like protein